MMQHDGMGRGMDWMHWGGPLVWLLILLILILGAVALVRYLRGPGR